jgi:succinate dehydrogenase / fumarate reductase, iron-sulfur subunit
MNLNQFSLLQEKQLRRISNRQSTIDNLKLLDMDFTLKIWRQDNARTKGRFVTYKVSGISSDCSFLEMLDQLNEQLVNKLEIPVCFDHDCREGICGMCSLYINGRPHGNDSGVTTCQLHMRKFKDGDTIWIEPWRARAFPIIRDLVVDRSAFDKIIQAGGYVSVSTGGVPDANAIPISKKYSELSMDAAQCIGCGACVAACKNASAMLFVSAKVSHLSMLPQGQVEAKERVQAMVAKMDELGFGNCTNTGACEAECPKEIKISNIARMNREFIIAKLT